MTSDDRFLAEFRVQIGRRLQERHKEWEASRRLIDGSRLSHTLQTLLALAETSNLSPAVRDLLVGALNGGNAQRIQDLSGPKLKLLTGLSPSKALRALCVFLGMAESSPSRWQTPSLDSETVSAFVRDHPSPLDLLLHADVASVLDLGAGDLSFGAELAEQYAPPLHRSGRTLILHCIDRLHPESKLGGPLHPPQGLTGRLRSRDDLSFRFLPDQDMCDFDQLVRDGRLAARYALSTCWAPATPTFAYEPTRLSQEVIHDHLSRTKGAFRPTRYGREAALEVQHGGRSLLFPPWKFEIRGPLALLDLLARSSHLGVLGAVDSQVFWELLAQLLEDDRYRPIDQPFTAENVAVIFGDIYDRLSTLAIGATLDLAGCGTLRRSLPRVLPGRLESGYRFRLVTIRRGAVFPNMPASSTARQFQYMAEEPPPWMVTVVPDR